MNNYRRNKKKAVMDGCAKGEAAKHMMPDGKMMNGASMPPDHEKMYRDGMDTHRNNKKKGK